MTRLVALEREAEVVLKIVVLAKEVPDSYIVDAFAFAGRLQLDPETKALKTEGIATGINAYDEQARKLADLFRENFSRFASQVTEEVRRAGPHS
jgi:ATP-dependent phosphoenolpyruvate carboxykinase